MAVQAQSQAAARIGTAFLLFVLWGLSAQAFIHAQVGTKIEDMELAALDGTKHHLLSNTTVNVFLFIKPGQEHTRTTLQQIAVCEREWTNKPVHCVAIVSDRIPKEDVEREIKESGLTMPVLVDVGDELYGKLGVALCPVAGVVDAEQKLVAYHAFTKLNFVAMIDARVRHLLKEINDEDLEKALKPPEATQGGDAEVARRFLKLAERQLQTKNYEKAMENAKKSIDKDTNSVAPHVLLGRIYAAQENWTNALAAFEQALKLEADNKAAMEGKKECEEKLPK